MCHSAILRASCALTWDTMTYLAVLNTVVSRKIEWKNTQRRFGRNSNPRARRRILQSADFYSVDLHFKKGHVSRNLYILWQ